MTIMACPNPDNPNFDPSSVNKNCQASDIFPYFAHFQESFLVGSKGRINPGKQNIEAMIEVTMNATIVGFEGLKLANTPKNQIIRNIFHTISLLLHHRI